MTEAIQLAKDSDMENIEHAALKLQRGAQDTNVEVPLRMRHALSKQNSSVQGHKVRGRNMSSKRDQGRCAVINSILDMCIDFERGCGAVTKILIDV